MPLLDEFAEIMRCEEPLAPYTHLRVGGPAQFFAQPRSVDELVRLVARCSKEGMPYRVLGGGCNVLVRDEGVRGVVIRLSEPAFTSIEIKGKRIKAAAGAPLSALISQAAQQSLGGVEALIGIPGTVGGAIRANAGSRSGYIREIVTKVDVLDPQGKIQTYSRDDLPFSSQDGPINPPIILSAEFELETDDPDAILKRMRKLWIQKKAQQPLSFQAAGRIFKDPKGMSADDMITQAGLPGTKVGGAEVSDRQANYIIAHPGAQARDVLRLIELVRSRVNERFGQMLQLEIVVW
jgi:UDP-N-acetylmuramate dehydrogenase